MDKIIDIDKLFDEYISDYVYSNIGKVKPEEIEDKIPVLYEEFGKKPLDALGGKSPEEYYKDMGAKELISLLSSHVKTGVSPSDFLCEALRDNDTEEALISSLSDENASEEFLMYVMNILNDKKSVKALSKYLDFVLFDYGESIKELATEFLKDNANSVADEILGQYKTASANTKEYLVEILSACEKRKEIFLILTEEFVMHPENVPLYAGYLAKYGDERALPLLYAAIERDNINYLDYEELRFAIESLGGKVEKERDFKDDKYYKKIKGISEKKN